MIELKDELFNGRHSCVIANGNNIRTFNQKGIKDLYHLLKEEPSYLRGASIADKVVGKAAAALMILGGVKEVFADVIGLSALAFLRHADIDVTFTQVVPYIINRNNTGMCPLEQMSISKNSPTEILEIIEEFAMSRVA